MGGFGEVSKGFVSQVLTSNENHPTESNSGLWGLKGKDHV